MTFRVLVSVLIACALALFLAPSVSAHATQPRIEISVERLNPGGVVDVRGVSFGMDDVVTLTLLGSTTEIPLGDVIANGEGEFLQIVVLPTDLVEGTYYIRATTSHHYVISPPLTVWGVAYEEGGGQGERDEDDGLLAPMPTFAPGLPAVTTASMPVAATPVTELPVASGFGANIIFLAGLMVLVAIFMFGFMWWKKNT